MTQATTKAPTTTNNNNPGQQGQRLAWNMPADYKSNDGKGGKSFLLDGIATDFRERANKDTGEMSVAGTVTWFGESEYCRLRFPSQAKLFQEGDWIHAIGSIRQFKDNVYAGDYVITHVNGVPVPKPRG